MSRRDKRSGGGTVMDLRNSATRMLCARSKSLIKEAMETLGIVGL